MPKRTYTRPASPHSRAGHNLDPAGMSMYEPAYPRGSDAQCSQCGRWPAQKCARCGHYYCERCMSQLAHFCGGF